MANSIFVTPGVGSSSGSAFTLGYSSLVFPLGTTLLEEAVDVLALRRGTNTQTLRIGPTLDYLLIAKGTGGASILTYEADALTFGVNSTGYFQVQGTGGHFTGFTALAGLGYAAGAGGAVTQITSRTTGVTVNAINGEITLVSAAGSTTAASFTVTNSAMAATDHVALTQKSGSNKYVLLVTAKASGSFEITVYTTGGVAVEAPVIGFAIVKGSAS